MATNGFRLAPLTPAVALWVWMSIVTLAGCATPTPPVPPDLKAANAAFTQAQSLGSKALDAAIWRSFGDPTLESLIAQARNANLDVRIAQQRVRQARAGSTAAASRLWPTVAACERRSGSDTIRR